MCEQGVGLTAVAYGPNLHHLLGFDPHPTERLLLLLMSQTSEVLIVPRLHAEDVEDFDVDDVVVYTDADGPDDGLRDALERLRLEPAGASPARRACVDEAMRADFLLLLEQALGGWSFSAGAPVLEPMRIVKGPTELDAMRRVVALTDDALEAIWPQIHEGMSELDAAEVVRSAFHASGADATAFCIVGFGPNSAAAHHQPTRRVLQDGDSVLIDIGARREGYHSDITRVGFLGEPGPEYLGVHGIVKAALDAALAAVRPGVPAAEVDRAAREVIAAAGYGRTFRHGVGHGIGLSVHEPPYLTDSNGRLLEEGMTFTLEPGVYRIGEFGIRLEQVVAVTASGGQVLTGSGLDAVRLEL